ncbi:TetR/AcrR family transcriptional regulator C-terminal domain-containing protein [Allosediminivita pacifica]|uniref:TetR/AcrR family transcriptional regulator C-terminal domain-containing protein n=1 Tax=Allosediminivita pacifica TaxID=1267769 RepID=UPI000D3C2FCA
MVAIPPWHSDAVGGRLQHQSRLAAFSLRELARTLGVSPAVIYWHVGGTKEDLFAEISASITGSLSASLDDGMPWDSRLRQVFRNYRTLVHRHPAVAPLLGAQMKSNGVANLDWVETILTALEEGGYRGDALRPAFNVLVGGLAGFVTMELAPAPVTRPGSDSGKWQALFAERVGQIDPQRYPLTARALPDISNRIFVLRWQNGADIPYGDSFELLLDLLIEGLKARAPTEPT